MFNDMTLSGVADSSMFFGKHTNFNLELAEPEVRQLLEAGIPRRGKGCYSHWKTNSNNVIQAFVLIIDSGMSSELQKPCIDAMVPASFGVLPIATTLDFSEGGEVSPRAC